MSTPRLKKNTVESKGLFITFEGIDGSGKSIQANALFKRLKKNNYPVHLIREPGGDPISEQIRHILLDKKNDNMSPSTELLLYESARAQLVDKIIRPALSRNEIVISDRFTDSTLAYQGYGRLISLLFVQQTNEWVCHNIRPDRTFLLDIPLEESIKRRSMVSSKNDRMETEQEYFFNRVRNGYLQIAKNNSKRICLLDGAKPIIELEQEIFQNVMILLEGKINSHIQRGHKQ